MSRWQKSQASLRVVLTGGLVALSLAACATPVTNAGGTPAPKRTESSSPTPQDSEPAAPSVARILVRSDGLQLVSESGDVLSAVAYLDPIDEVVDTLSTAIGTAPEVAPHDGGIESPSGTYYRWDGLQLNDIDAAVVAPTNPEWVVRLNGPSAGAVALSTADHVAVGNSEADVEELVPDTLMPLTVNQETVLDGEYDVRQVGEGDSGNSLTHSVFVRLSGVPLTVTLIAAPSGNFGV